MDWELFVALVVIEVGILWLFTHYAHRYMVNAIRDFNQYIKFGKADWGWNATKRKVWDERNLPYTKFLKKVRSGWEWCKFWKK